MHAKGHILGNTYHPMTLFPNRTSDMKMEEYQQAYKIIYYTIINSFMQKQEVNHLLKYHEFNGRNIPSLEVCGD
mgnify:CR=1 FL=1